MRSFHAIKTEPNGRVALTHGVSGWDSVIFTWAMSVKLHCTSAMDLNHEYHPTPVYHLCLYQNVEYLPFYS